ncbi:hypothetical protein [Micromonospora craterilacus]|uniref:hypothetical protein n=1 Tax=Micromonospora craterilacus TaxID=1655439 RepID=UPI001F41BDD5|nr:hypothetical protein [Micromonospora craterilacus]
MSRPVREHVPSRPTWRCRACGIAWPCSAAKLRLLAEYQGNTPGRMVYLVTLREEAIEQLTERNPATHLPDLHKRFTDWVPVRSPRMTEPDVRSSNVDPDEAANVEAAVAHATVNAALEGIEFDEDWQDRLRDVASGVTDADELIAQEIARISGDRDTRR